MKILVTEDSAVVRERILKLLAPFSKIIKIFEAETISKSLEVILAQKPDVLVLDIQLPDGSGIDLLKQLPQNNLINKKIILTNHFNVEYWLECKAAGADYFFDKSTQFLKVKEVIENLLKKNSQQ